MSTFNSFLAMAFEPEDAAIYAIRSDLANAIAGHLRERKIKQANAAGLLGLPQSAISNIVRNNIEHLSIERLIRAMIRAKIPGWASWPNAEKSCAGISTQTAAVTMIHDLEDEIWSELEPLSPDAITALEPAAMGV